ncbi:MAG: bifunctional aspartate kinase/homoserine dehydrogenase I [Candidatus Symbiothrix sp.]|jgi:aspartokinase/homoserine dehydrogenase 1|nr:bifunctional aspartate kinase/homoserine dehydrogenase I [Candidatus Symbiothrix sp.]
MRVMKFGGTSVGSATTILQVKKIVEAVDEPVIVVVSAFGGITDQLLTTARFAARGDIAYEQELDLIEQRHREVLETVLPKYVIAGLTCNPLQGMTILLDELKNILKGVFLVKELSQKTSDSVVSYGERLSSLILAAVLDGARLFDARAFIQTDRQFTKHIVDFKATNALIEQTFGDSRLRRNDTGRLRGNGTGHDIVVVPGFIASDKNTGDITNLGRGGSDYTASILAAALHARILEIWTDVDGFMTADPRVITNAYVIEKMTYVEAMELSNFGAKVIYPPTIYPAYHENIPILIKNTFKPDAPGTYITRDNHKDDKPIRGISSINDTSLITVQGLGMVGVIGVNYRIFKALSKIGVSVFMVSQTASENTSTLAVRDADADLAVEALRKEFEQELRQGEINDFKVEKGLATVAIVGENMKHVPGIAGKLFATLGRSGISTIALAQSASETNISFVIKSEYLRKTLNSLHDSFFLSEYQVLNIFLVGVRTVGGQLLETIRRQQKPLMEHNGLKLNVVGIARKNKMLLDRNGINLENCIAKLDTEGLESTPQKLQEAILQMNIFNSVFVDCTASAEVAELYEAFLSHNISVVAANKVAASGAYKNYCNLKEAARKTGAKYLFETNVGAGLPIINTMNALTNSGDKILKLEAVLSGTLNFIFNTLSADIPLSKAIQLAQEAGFAEPDPRLDLNGTDVIRKLVILSREAGYEVNQSDVEKNLFIPDKYFEGSTDNFWQKISELDAGFETKRQTLAAEGKKSRFVAVMDNGKCSVGLQSVTATHPFYELEGSNNIIMITTERYYEYPMIIKGYGAGAAVTAAGVFSDIISIANIR